jgi:hypothetical protein
VLVVGIGHHGAQVLAHQLRVFLDRLGHGAEDHPHVMKLLLEGGGHRDAVEHRVDRHAGEPLLLHQGNAELLVGAQQLRVDLVQALRPLGGLGGGVVVGVLVVDRREGDLGPLGLCHGEPVLIGLEPPVEQPVRLALLVGDEPDDVLVEALGRGLGLDVGHEAVLVALVGDLLNLSCRFDRGSHLSPFDLLVRDPFPANA